jgi:hypothetical protein
LGVACLLGDSSFIPVLTALVTGFGERKRAHASPLDGSRGRHVSYRHGGLVGSCDSLDEFERHGRLNDSRDGDEHKRDGRAVERQRADRSEAERETAGPRDGEYTGVVRDKKRSVVVWCSPSFHRPVR